MSPVNPSLLDWLEGGRRLVAATLVDRAGSSPLEPGAMMLIDELGNVEGSVTGGCVEGALVEHSHELFAGGPPRLLSFGISDELAGTVGLMCGGTVHIFCQVLAEPEREVLAWALAAAERAEAVAIATLLDGERAGSKMAIGVDQRIGGLGLTDLLDRSVAGDARGLITQGTSLVRRYASDGARLGAELRVHIQTHAPRPRMAIFGAIDFSAALAPLARRLGYEVTICDARAPFLSSPRFAEAAEVVVAWPDDYLAGCEFGPRDAIIVMTHDPKFDEPALIGALATDAGYIGALGSRKTQADRRRRLREAGVSDDELQRICGPCGLDIGARTPAETAVSILAEIVALRSGREGARLSTASGSIRSEVRTLTLA